MLQQNNVERMFDHVLKKALPCLILSPPEFRNNLAERVNTLFILSQGGDSSITNFRECYEHIMELLKTTPEFFDSTTNRQIEALRSKYQTFDERISELNERMILLEKSKNNPTKKSIPINHKNGGGKAPHQKIQELIIPNPIIETILSPPIIQTKSSENPTCLKCGRVLNRKGSINGIRNYYCTRRTGGCGKTYKCINGELVMAGKKTNKEEVI